MIISFRKSDHSRVRSVVPNKTSCSLVQAANSSGVWNDLCLKVRHDGNLNNVSKFALFEYLLWITILYKPRKPKTYFDNCFPKFSTRNTQLRKQWPSADNNRRQSSGLWSCQIVKHEWIWTIKINLMQRKIYSIFKKNLFIIIDLNY